MQLAGFVGGTGMTLEFVHRDCAYDRDADAVCFLAKDGGKPVTFAVSREALETLEGTAFSNNAQIAAAFEHHLDLIHTVAAEVYLVSQGDDFGDGYRLGPAHFSGRTE